MKLSIAMIVRNEEKYLEECLMALGMLRKSVSSELIIVDTGSTDNTVAIARKYTEKVFQYEWNNNFADMRNLAISHCTGEWVFVLDADEILEDSNSLIAFFNKGVYKKYNSGAVKIKNVLDDGEHPRYNILPLVRLFKRDKEFRYEGVIHEQPKFKEPLLNLDTALKHYGYLHTDKDLMEKKFKRNVELLKKELDKNPQNHYYWFQLSKSYAAYEDYENALNVAEKALEVTKEKGLVKTSLYIYVQLALCYLWNRKYDKLESLCLEAIKVKDGYLDIYFLLAKAQLELGKDQDAINNYKIYLEMVDNYDKYAGSKDISVGNETGGLKEVAILDLIISYSRLEKHEKVLECCARVNTLKNLIPVFQQMIEAYLELGKLTELGEFYFKEIEGEEFEGDFLSALEGQAHTEYEQFLKVFSKGDSSYALLNSARFVLVQEAELDEGVLESLAKLDFGVLPEYYGDVIYLFMKNEINISVVLGDLSDNQKYNFISYISDKYEDFSEQAMNYLSLCGEVSDLKFEMTIKVLAQKVLQLAKLDLDSYRIVFNRYVLGGIFALEQTYRDEIYEGENSWALRSEEDAFFMFTRKAFAYKELDSKKYFEYLKKAVNASPSMKKGIEILVDDFEREIETKETSTKIDDPELKAYEVMFKEKINELVNLGQLADAKLLIEEYLKIVPGDAEMIMLRSGI